MSRGIGPVLLTHFTPDEAEADTVEESALDAAPAPAGDKAKTGVLVAPAPTGKSARHRAGRGKRALVLSKPRNKAAGDTAESAETTNELPLLDQLRNTPRNIRILAMTAGAVVLIAIAFGLVRPATELAGTPTPAGPGRANGMQPGTLPDAALSGVPTTTQAPPPSTTQAAAPPPTTHHTTTHSAPPTTVTTQDQSAGSGLAVDGQPCSNPGDFTFDTHYRPVECANDGSGNLTWQRF
jgi:hypothetical protein